MKYAGDNNVMGTPAWDNRFHIHTGGPVYGKAKVGEQDFLCRVDYVLYDDKDAEKYQLYSGRIGTIECTTVIDSSMTPRDVVAFPMSPHVNNPPIVNELVLVRVAASEKVQNSKGNYSVVGYYTTIIPTWGSKEHNVTPDQNYQGKSFTGDRFFSTGLVRPLIHNPGDITYEGRFGNTIRLGSSNATSEKSPFKGDNSKPLIVIRNKQNPDLKKELNAAIYEDVNKDGGTIYFLSGQYNPLILGNYNFESYNQNIDKIKSNIVQAQEIKNTAPTQSLVQSEILPVSDVKPKTKEIKLAPSSSKPTIPVADELENIPDEEGFITETDPDSISLPNSESDVYEDKDNPSVALTNIMNILPVPHIIQNGSWKCYLASTEMVFKYFGSYTVTQDSIPKEQKYLDSSRNFYSQPFYKNKGFNLKTVQIKGGKEGYSQILNIFNSQKPKIPLILERQPTNQKFWDTSRRHFVVIVGVTKDNTIIVNDPGRRDGKNVPLKPEQLLKNGGTLRLPLKL